MRSTMTRPNPAPSRRGVQPDGQRARWTAIGALVLAASVALSSKLATRRTPVVTAEPSAAAQRSAAPEGEAPGDAELVAFIRLVTDDVNRTWQREFAERDKPYTAPELVLFSPERAPGCSATSPLTGGPACPRGRAYIDLSFQRELDLQHGPDATATRAYVIAHELGHHVQRALGIDTRAAELLADKPVAAHGVSVQLELQADCLAGVWNRRTRRRDLLPREAVETALRRASELGTTRHLARRDGEGAETFTYAIPRQRLYWFAQGFSKGQIQDCDTFAR